MGEARKTVAVIGGGISGLAAAYDLMKKSKELPNVDYVLLEASDRLGGVIVTEKVDGFLIEGGPDCAISTKPETIQLANELGLGDRLLNSSEENKGTSILSGNRLHPLPDGVMTMVPTKLGPFLKTKLISWPGKLRVSMDLIIPAKKDDREESLAQFVRRRLGQEILDKIAEPLVGGIHASDPEQMSLESTFPRFIEMEKEYGSLIKGSLAGMKKMKEMQAKAAAAKTSAAPKRPHRTFFVSMAGGMQELTDGVVEALDKDKIKTGKKVAQIVRDEKKGQYELRFDDGSKLSADAVIVALPSFAAGHVVGDLDKSLAEELAKIPFVDSATISLGFSREDMDNVPKGFGIIVPLAEKRKLMACTWSSNKWAGRAEEGLFLARGFVGGAKNQGYVDLSDEELIQLVRSEFRDIAGITAEPKAARVFRWRKGMAQYILGHAKRVASIEEKASALPGFYLAGNSYRGVGISDCIKSGRKAAEEAVEYLKT